MEYKLEITEYALQIIKNYIGKTDMFDSMESMSEEELIKKFFWLIELDMNFDIHNQFKITKLC